MSEKNIEGLESVVVALVKKKIEAEDMFTAHDITLESRAAGHWGPHDPVKDSVHSLFLNGNMAGYVRTVIKVPTGSPFLYHPATSDPTGYANVRGGTIGSSIVVLDNEDEEVEDEEMGEEELFEALDGPDSLMDGLVEEVEEEDEEDEKVPLPVNKPNTTDNRAVDSRKTLSIPVFLLKKNGFAPHQKVYAVGSAEGVEISSVSVEGAAVQETYTVDEYNQIRLTQSFLSRAGIAGLNYDVGEAAGKIFVKLHK